MLRELGATFLLSLAMLGVQIGWTRIFSFMPRAVEAAAGAVAVLICFASRSTRLPLPAAVAALGDDRRDLVVRGWVLNGYLSVLGACLAMILAISFGFGAVLWTGAAIYAAAAAAWLRASRELRESGAVAS